ncbi:transposase [Streptomyces olivaceoviridis]
MAGKEGAPWRDLPSEYGPWWTVYGLIHRWQRDGIRPLLLTGCRPGRMRWG